ncbi:hypothetical protein MI170_15790 [Mycolicibacterium goodii]|uniref:hypothetical protein n=1 Tax=Mycolicibacterium goodii TaxID=134601 RepID=UPI001FFB68EF|nr:hypothetical protein [Mycolicibacterium goodii]ULN50665.1 hypothetical protein MI170_15790 [Mycolicibacterium goodii]
MRREVRTMLVPQRRRLLVASTRIALVVGVLISSAGCAAAADQFAESEEPMTTLPVPANIPPFPLPDGIPVVPLPDAVPRVEMPNDIPRVQAPAEVPRAQLPADIPRVPLPSAIPPIVFP